jgi:oxygen-independent coproporphyrinogen-3 oxidase
MKDAEITIEANPGTLNRQKLASYRSQGINRISLGVQSTKDDELALLTRIHTYQDVIESVRLAREEGFDNISLDLIYGLPNQTLVDWQENVYRVLELQPEHLSIYSLTVEEGTPLFEQIQQGTISEPDPDAAGDMLEWSIEELPRLGYEQYEISNWARSGKNERDYRSRHNLQYWLNRWYLGFGVGAHEYFDGLRVANNKVIPIYIQKMDHLQDWKETYRTGVDTWSEIPLYEQMQDEMMLRFRLVREGVDLAEFERKFGVSAMEVFPGQIKSLLGKGLISFSNNNQRLCLTRHGILHGNQVFLEFVGAD